MRDFRIILLITALVSLVSFASAQKSKELDTFGYYYIKKPIKAFSDISEIHLSGNYGKSEKPRFYGLIRLKNNNAKDFHLLNPIQKGSYISFTTKTVAEISYKFNGSFTKLFIKNQESTDKLNYGGIVLRGTLIKLRRGLQIAKQVVEFTYFTGT
jgi:hypothetical protein